MFSFYVMTSLNDVITSKFLLNWKALIKTFHMRYYTIWYHMVPSISKFDLQVSKFRPAARPMKVNADRPQKLIRPKKKKYVCLLSPDRPYFFTPTLELFIGKFLKIFKILKILSFSGNKWDNFINNSCKCV